MVRRTFWLMKVVPTWKKFEKRCLKVCGLARDWPRFSLGRDRGLNGLSHVTAKEIISIFKVHVILQFQNEDRVRMFVQIFFFVVLRSKAGHGLLILRILDHTQRRTTLGRTPLDLWSARPRDLYLETCNIHNNHPCPRGIQPTISASERTQTYARLSKIPI